MPKQIVGWVAVLGFLSGNVYAQPPEYLTVRSVASANGPTAAELVDAIVDEASGVTVVANTVTTAINASGTPGSDTRALAEFEDGMVLPGTILHVQNQVDPNNPTATYSGGIGIPDGVCLCTGLVSDGDGTPSSNQRGLGVEGPNNGEPQENAGEITTVLGKPIDVDFDNYAFPTSASDGGDATVLQFDIQILSPGFLRMSFVFGSDEYPAWITQQFNDSFAILIKRVGESYTNIATLKEPGQSPKPFNLHEIADCGAPMFLLNDVAPAPSVLPASLHHISGAPYFDHEFGGFTKLLTRETPLPLAPGFYTIKVVIQDVGANPSGNDMIVDSALFLAQESVKLFAFRYCDLNLDGVVNLADKAIITANFGLSPASYWDGDVNGDGAINAADYVVWSKFRNLTGNANLSADFNRDGLVNIDDWNIWNTYQGLDHCASRFEGDADGDGDVDANDEPDY